MLKLTKADLSGISDLSPSLVYSFNIIVHFEPEIVESYVRYIYRVLKSGGIAFMHHSNLSHTKKQDFKKQPQLRNYLTKEIMADFIHKAGITIINQDVFDWDESYQDPVARATF